MNTQTFGDKQFQYRDSTVSRLLAFAHGCGHATHVAGTNGGTMPCGANLTMFGKTSPYYCNTCDAILSDLAARCANRIIYHAEFALTHLDKVQS